jgi:Uma2 family endonuclease
MFEHFLSWLYIRQLWGPRCDGFEPDCFVCQKWREHDEVFNEAAG